MRLPRPLVAIALLVPAVAIPARRTHAQSCAAADSGVGPVIAKKAYKLVYDGFTDTTVAVGKGDYHSPMMGQSAMFLFNTYFQGKTPGRGVTRIIVTADQMGEGGALVGRTNGHQLTPANAKYADTDALLLLLDDTVRLRLPRIGYKAELKAAGALLPESLHETLTFDVTPAALLALGRATSIEVRVGDIRTHFGKGQSESAREMYRLLACAPQPAPANAASSPAAPAIVDTMHPAPAHP